MRTIGSWVVSSLLVACSVQLPSGTVRCDPGGEDPCPAGYTCEVRTGDSAAYCYSRPGLDAGTTMDAARDTGVDATPIDASDEDAEVDAGPDGGDGGVAPGWSQVFGGSAGSDNVSGVAVQGSATYTAGAFVNIATLGGRLVTDRAMGRDAFVTRQGSDGRTTHIARTVGAGDEWYWGVGVNATAVWAVGTGDAPADYGAGTVGTGSHFSLVSYTLDDLSLIEADVFEVTGSITVNDLVVSDTEVCVAGRFDGEIDFGNGPRSAIAPGRGFIACYDASSRTLLRADTDEGDVVHTVLLDAEGAVWFAGRDVAEGFVRAPTGTIRLPTSAGVVNAVALSEHGGEIWVAGTFGPQIQFDSACEARSLASVSGPTSAVFLLAISPSDLCSSAFAEYGDTGAVQVGDLLATNEAIYITGNTTGELEGQTSSGMMDAFVLAVSPSDRSRIDIALWGTPTSNEVGNALAPYGTGFVLVGGSARDGTVLPYGSIVGGGTEGFVTRWP